ncbi:MAG TPA: hypothetical protein VH370_09270 [Humisphaera sp.]|jgi:hypothetical protein|nr:hypothetical protein [Humisphaera sp.]
MTHLPDEDPDGMRSANRKRWAVFRIVLGNAQMIGAAAGTVLLVMTGTSRATLTVVGITAIFTITSLLIFRDPPRS